MTGLLAGTGAGAAHEWAGRSFEDILGPPQHRYFGDGFRRVGHVVNAVHLDEVGSAGSLLGRVSARYPIDWSHDADGAPREVHLSSFDAIAMTAEILRAGALLSSSVRGALDATVLQLRVKAPARVSAITHDVDVAVRTPTWTPHPKPSCSRRGWRDSQWTSCARGATTVLPPQIFSSMM